MKKVKTVKIQFLPPHLTGGEPLYGLYIAPFRWVAAGMGTNSIAMFRTIEAAEKEAYNLGYELKN